MHSRHRRQHPAPACLVVLVLQEALQDGRPLRQLRLEHPHQRRTALLQQRTLQYSDAIGEHAQFHLSCCFRPKTRFSVGARQCTAMSCASICGVSGTEQPCKRPSCIKALLQCASACCSQSLAGFPLLEWRCHAQGSAGSKPQGDRATGRTLLAVSGVSPGKRPLYSGRTRGAGGRHSPALTRATMYELAYQRAKPTCGWLTSSDTSRCTRGCGGTA
jgi:hypothetical protein